MWARLRGAASAAVLLVCVLAYPTPAHAAQDDSPVVLVGISGLTWSDVVSGRTPALAAFAEQAAVGNLSVRSVYRVTCPVDAWLTVGAARRAAVERAPNTDESDNTADLNAICPPIPRIDEGQVLGWSSLSDYNQELSFNAVLGLLGSTARQEGVSLLGVGSGGGVGAADEEGVVDGYVADPGTLSAQQLSAADLTLIDLGGVNERPAQAPPRQQQLAALDAAFASVLEKVPTDATLMLMAPANSRPAAELQVMAIRGDTYPPGLLSSSSTKQDGLVALTDVTPTVFDLTGMEPSPDFVGSPMTVVHASGDAAERMQWLADQARKVEVYSDVAPPFFTALVPLQILLYGAAAWALRQEQTPRRRRRILILTTWVAMVCSAIPVSTFLANLIPWWTWERAHVALVSSVLACALAVGVIAQWVIRRQGDLLAGVGTVAGVTAGVLALDVVTGATLQTASLMGYSPTIAGRFYGFGNVAFSLFATSLVFLAAWWGDVFARRGQTQAVPWVVLLVGASGVVIDGLPVFGSDFGGMLAITTGFGVFYLGTRSIRLTVGRLLAVFGVGVAVVAVVSIADWLRPAQQRSHLGTFVQQVVDGELVDIVGRKLGNNVDILFSSVLGLLVPVAALFIAFVLLRPFEQTASVLKRAFSEAPLLRPALVGWLVLMVVGFALNDSGVAIPAVGIMLTVPFLITVSAQMMLVPGANEPSDPAVAQEREA